MRKAELHRDFFEVGVIPAFWIFDMSKEEFKKTGSCGLENVRDLLPISIKTFSFAVLG